MNFFMKSSKHLSAMPYKRYSVPLTNLCTKTLIHKCSVSSKENKTIFSPTAQFARFHFNSSNQKVDIGRSSQSQNISQVLSVFKKVDLRELKNSPFPAVVYGFGGIIPFVFPPIYFILGSYSSFLATSQFVYGATILAFVGGVKWGNAVAKSDVSHIQIGLSTIPSLVAWTSILVPEPVGPLVVSAGLFSALYIDLVSSNYPPWFFAMRSTLTGIAITSLFTTMLFYIFH